MMKPIVPAADVDWSAMTKFAPATLFEKVATPVTPSVPATVALRPIAASRVMLTSPLLFSTMLFAAGATIEIVLVPAEKVTATPVDEASTAPSVSEWPVFHVARQICHSAAEACSMNT